MEGLAGLHFFALTAAVHFFVVASSSNRSPSLIHARNNAQRSTILTLLHTHARFLPTRGRVTRRVARFRRRANWLNGYPESMYIVVQLWQHQSPFGSEVSCTQDVAWREEISQATMLSVEVINVHPAHCHVLRLMSTVWKFNSNYMKDEATILH